MMPLQGFPQASSASDQQQHRPLLVRSFPTLPSRKPYHQHHCRLSFLVCRLVRDTQACLWTSTLNKCVAMLLQTWSAVIGMPQIQYVRLPPRRRISIIDRSSRQQSPFIKHRQLTPVQYAFNDPYITPYPSSTIESHPWTQHARASIPNTSLYPYDSDPTQLPPHPSPSRLTSDRPQSSPSTFGPFPETIQWSMPNALGIHYSTPSGQPTPVTSTFPPSVFQQTYPQNQNLPQGPYRNSSPLAHELHQPQPRRTFHPLAPHPPPTHKRPYDGLSASNPGSDQGETTTPLPKRRRTSSTTSTKTTKTTGTGTGTEPTPLSPDDRFLVHLKEEAALPWKDIAARFSHERGGGGSRTYTVAALQMRYKRLKERVRVWEMRDLEALRAAHEFWERGRWEIIAYKVR